MFQLLEMATPYPKQKPMKHGKLRGKTSNLLGVITTMIQKMALNTVNDPRGLAPAGYHIPTDAEWTVLTDYLGGEDVAGKKMKSTSGWDSYTTGGSKTCPNCKDWNAEYRKKVPCHTCKDTRSVPAPTVTHSGNGSNSSGFSGLPAGGRYGLGTFGSVGEGAYWWSSTETATGFAWGRALNDGDSSVGRGDGGKGGGLSVRCLRD